MASDDISSVVVARCFGCEDIIDLFDLAERNKNPICCYCEGCDHQVQVMFSRKYIQTAGKSSLECPIDRAEFIDPVMVPCCGQSFNRSSLWEWLHDNPTCPICRQDLRRFEVSTVPTNVALRDALGIKEDKKEKIVPKINRDPKPTGEKEELQFMIKTALRNDLPLALNILQFVNEQNITLEFSMDDMNNIFLSDDSDHRSFNQRIINIKGTKRILESIALLMKKHIFSCDDYITILKDHYFNLDFFDDFVSLFALNKIINIPDITGKTALYRLLENVQEPTYPGVYEKQKIEKVMNLPGLDTHIKCQERSFLDLILEERMVWAFNLIADRLIIDDFSQYIRKTTHEKIKSKLTKLWFKSFKSKDRGEPSSGTVKKITGSETPRARNLEESMDVDDLPVLNPEVLDYFRTIGK
jgi:hypothetical protein